MKNPTVLQYDRMFNFFITCRLYESLIKITIKLKQNRFKIYITQSCLVLEWKIERINRSILPSKDVEKLTSNLEAKKAAIK